MAPPTSFDHGLLRRLISSHPGWNISQLADALTQDNRRHDPEAPPVRPDTVRTVIWRRREEWESQGVTIPEWGNRKAEYMPPLGTVAAGHRMHLILRRLRDLAREAEGTAIANDGDRERRATALRWEESTLKNPPDGCPRIVDLSAEGEPVIRFAREDELDKNGNLKAVAAWQLPGWRAAPRPRAGARDGR